MEQIPLRHENRTSGILDHQRQPVRGVGWVERNVRRPRLENPVEAGQQVCGPLKADADQHLRPRAQPAQVPGQLVGRAIELAIAQLLVAGDHGYRVRRSPDLLLEEPVHGRVVAICLLGGIPGNQHPFAIGLIEERDLREPFVDVCGHVLQEDGEAALELENPGLIEDRGPIRPVTGPSVARDRDREVVVRGVARCVLLQDPDGQPHVPTVQLRRASHE